ncbi:putative bifunctional transcriptional activator/DNA repair enzyme AlkA [Meiothermus luteus]|uniref:DNA-3-methyladenine glycosylase II n=1 Tax=Meiothermus luteus TaxID=2026184 RepID=A0A399ESZ9_9DEIN|nr:DNA-3-methyladenine glycosylase [Meiothermus luteus]RIH86179.1 putative bifunctional transcriptional activator/DNA repair enzyme AlkA [Meiothermus luteus]RMH54797.1 MAG: DNA-3-methyladenine glycosylase 2 family protein [Deinococcota bacterium]
MQGLAERYGPAPFSPHPFPRRSPFAVLLGSVVGQQLSSKAAGAIWRRLEGRFPLEPGVLAQASFEDLRAVGLSAAKVRCVWALSRFALEGGLQGVEGLPDPEVVRRLTQLKGVGVWTAQMFLMFGLGRPDVWPLLDLGLRRGAQRVYGVADQRGLELLGERFRPYRSHAAWYLWRAVEDPSVTYAPFG